MRKYEVEIRERFRTIHIIEMEDDIKEEDLEDIFKIKAEHGDSKIVMEEFMECDEVMDYEEIE